jgi:hypothetical protein
MYVVFHAADDQGGTFPVFENARLVGPKAFADVFGNPCLPVFRAADKVDQVLDQRLRYGGASPVCFALPGLVFLTLS